VSVLARVGVDSPDVARVRIALFRSFLLALVAVEAWERASRLDGRPGTRLALVLALAATAAAAAVWRAGWALPVVAVTAAVVGVDFVSQFPANPNHQYLQAVLLALLLLLRDGVDAEAVRLTICLRWLVVIALLHAGLQKLAWGHYFDGELLGYAVTQNERFRSVLQLWMPGSELERLSHLVLQEGAGPFRVDSPLFVLVSNVAWLGELLLPVLLLLPATRKLGVIGTLAYFVAIESAARELFFGGMMAALVLCFAPLAWMQRARPLGFAGLAVLLATTFGLLPRWFFS
jgi:hypothetical protein